MQTRTRPKSANPLLDANNFLVALYGDEGMSSKFIQEKTGMTKSQVLYRLKAYDIRLSNYRNGNSLSARAVLQHGRQMVGYHLEAALRAKYGNQRT
jgi:hypothetical protein